MMAAAAQDHCLCSLVADVFLSRSRTVESFDISDQGQRDNFGIVFSGYLKIVERDSRSTPIPLGMAIGAEFQSRCSTGTSRAGSLNASGERFGRIGRIEADIAS